LWFFTALAALAGVFGAGALAREPDLTGELRSGSPGYRQSKSGKHQQWHRPALTVYLDDSLKRVGPQAEDAVMQAFGQWLQSDPRLPAVTFDTTSARATPKQDGLSTISYGRIELPGHERDLAITVTYAKEESGEILEADIIINSLYPVGVLATKRQAGSDDQQRDVKGDRHDSSKHDGHSDDEADDCRSRFDLQNVTTHEAGHFFGLGEDPVERGATMFQAIDQCETHKRALAATDIGAMSALYAVSSTPSSVEVAGSEPTQAGVAACQLVAPGAGGSTLAGLLPGGLLALLAWRRRRATGRC
jgi:hypothetical protein